jgi:hypothetical protein
LANPSPLLLAPKNLSKIVKIVLDNKVLNCYCNNNRQHPRR